MILVRAEYSPEDIHGMHAAAGILTARGSMNSHEAVVARGMGRPCVCGASSIHIDAQNKTLQAEHFTLKEGDYIAIDGDTGYVYGGSVSFIDRKMSAEFSEILKWIDSL